MNHSLPSDLIQAAFLSKDFRIRFLPSFIRMGCIEWIPIGSENKTIIQHHDQGSCIFIMLSLLTDLLSK